MKKFVFQGLALAMGLAASSALGQYPGGYGNFGPSAYPVAPQPTMQSLPEVPQGYQPQNIAPMAQQAVGQQYVGQQAMGQQPVAQPYQLIANQSQVYGVQSGGTVLQGAPVPQPMPHSHAPATTPMAGAPMAHAPMTGAPATSVPSAGCQSCGPTTQMGYGYAAQSIAPNCSTCGPAPVSQSYTMASPSCGYSAPARTGIFSGMPVGAKPWFFNAGALIFNRVDHKNVPLSFADADYATDILSTRDARLGTAAGVEIGVGRYFNCGRNAISATYWGVFPNDVTVTRARTTAGDYRSRIPFTYMEMAGTPAAPATPYPVYDWYDNAFTHSLTRSAEYHNVEVNLLGFGVGCAARTFNRPTAGSLFSGLGGRRSGCGHCGGAGCDSCATSCNNACAPSKFATGPCCLTAPACGSRLNLTWLAGFRYFHFSDNLLYAASLADSVIDRSADDFYYQVDTTNDLIGFQMGGRADYCVGRRFNLYSTAKAGVYNNRSTLFTSLGTDFDYAYLNDTRTPVNPNNGQDYLFNETKNQVAFLSELGTGVGIRLTCKWTATVGYRAVIASGVATAPDNVRVGHAHYADIRDFDNYGTLILHGFNFGGVYNF